MGRAFICPNTGCPYMSLFSCLDPGQAAVLGRERLGRHYDPGDTVYYSDTPALAVHCIHAGVVHLTRPTRGGKAILVGVRRAGDVLSFREVIAGTPYHASAEVMAPSMICAVPREAFLGVVKANLELALRLMTRMAREYAGTETQLVLRAHLDVTSRLARLLSDTVAEGVNENVQGRRPAVRMGREEMALLVGSTRETVSRSLKELALRGTIRLGDGLIEVLDLRVLQHLAD